MESEKITFCLTACGRPDLLAVTLTSFLSGNCWGSVSDFYIYEDSGTDCNKELQKIYPFIHWLKPKKVGQIKALDILWSKVKTNYAFFCEDDWQFLKCGFIEKSMTIMNSYPEVLQVRLCPLEPQNQHPIISLNSFKILKSHTGLWAALNFNPSLRRKSDYDLIGCYSHYTVFNPKKPWKSEAAISQVYTDLGFKAAMLNDTYIKHIGEGRHI